MVRARHSGLLSDIAASGDVDPDALDSIVRSFADDFIASGPHGIDVEPEAQPGADVRVVDSEVTLPEEDISRPDEGS